MGVFTFSTGANQLLAALDVIMSGEAETQGFALNATERADVVEELINAIAGASPMIVIVRPSDPDTLSGCRARVYEHLAREWTGLVTWDEEDRTMISEASIAYAKYGLIRTRGGLCRPRPMILATDDRMVHGIAEGLDRSLKSVLRAQPDVALLGSQLVARIIHVLSYDQLRRLARSIARA